jgi:hypothetical protein
MAIIRSQKPRGHVSFLGTEVCVCVCRGTRLPADNQRTDIFFPRQKSAFSPQSCGSNWAYLLTILSKFHSAEFISGFINVYKVDNCLWKVKDKSYSYKDIREKARDQLLDHDKQYNTSPTNESVRSKINNLRSAFRKELKNLTESKKKWRVCRFLIRTSLW